MQWPGPHQGFRLWTISEQGAQLGLACVPGPCRFRPPARWQLSTTVIPAAMRLPDSFPEAESTLALCPAVTLPQ